MTSAKVSSGTDTRTGTETGTETGTGTGTGTDWVTGTDIARGQRNYSRKRSGRYEDRTGLRRGSGQTTPPPESGLGFPIGIVAAALTVPTSKRPMLTECDFHVEIATMIRATTNQRLLRVWSILIGMMAVGAAVVMVTVMIHDRLQ